MEINLILRTDKVVYCRFAHQTTSLDYVEWFGEFDVVACRWLAITDDIRALIDNIQQTVRGKTKFICVNYLNFLSISAFFCEDGVVEMNFHGDNLAPESQKEIEWLTNFGYRDGLWVCLVDFDSPGNEESICHLKQQNLI